MATENEVNEAALMPDATGKVVLCKGGHGGGFHILTKIGRKFILLDNDCHTVVLTSLQMQQLQRIDLSAFDA